MTPTPEIRTVARRKLLLTSAWAVPVIAVASATPAFAASNEKRVDLSSQARVPNEARSGVNNGTSYWQGPRTLTFDFTYTNSGPDPLPAGAMVSIGLPFAAAWDRSLRRSSVTVRADALAISAPRRVGRRIAPARPSTTILRDCVLLRTFCAPGVSTVVAPPTPSRGLFPR